MGSFGPWMGELDRVLRNLEDISSKVDKKRAAIIQEQLDTRSRIDALVTETFDLLSRGGAIPASELERLPNKILKKLDLSGALVLDTCY